MDEDKGKDEDEDYGDYVGLIKAIYDENPYVKRLCKAIDEIDIYDFEKHDIDLQDIYDLHDELKEVINIDRVHESTEEGIKNLIEGTIYYICCSIIALRLYYNSFFQDINVIHDEGIEILLPLLDKRFNSIFYFEVIGLTYNLKKYKKIRNVVLYKGWFSLLLWFYFKRKKIEKVIEIHEMLIKDYETTKTLCEEEYKDNSINSIKTSLVDIASILLGIFYTNGIYINQFIGISFNFEWSNYSEYKNIEKAFELLSKYDNSEFNYYFHINYNIGRYYEEKKVYEKAVKYYLEHYLQNIEYMAIKAISAYRLGVCYEHGRGIEKDLEEALYYYKQSSMNYYDLDNKTKQIEAEIELSKRASLDYNIEMTNKFVKDFVDKDLRVDEFDIDLFAKEFNFDKEDYYKLIYGIINISLPIPVLKDRGRSVLVELYNKGYTLPYYYIVKSDNDIKKNIIAKHSFESLLAFRGYQCSEKDSNMSWLSNSYMVDDLDGLVINHDEYHYLNSFEGEVGIMRGKASSNNKYAKLHFATLGIMSKNKEVISTALKYLEELLVEENFNLDVNYYLAGYLLNAFKNNKDNKDEKRAYELLEVFKNISNYQDNYNIIPS